jgi:hypothetical protein
MKGRAMTHAEIRRELKKRIDAMPAKYLRPALEYLNYLIALGPRPSLKQRLREADLQHKSGLGTPWEKLRRKYGVRKVTPERS